jgi:hypothetical protein
LEKNSKNTTHDLLIYLIFFIPFKLFNFFKSFFIIKKYEYKKISLRTFSFYERKKRVKSRERDGEKERNKKIESFQKEYPKTSKVRFRNA